ncbi:MAG: hypothetical protein ACFFDQ_13150 [Candidatus Thorarchaeota archaeon]
MYGKSIAKTSESKSLGSETQGTIRSGTLIAIVAAIAVLAPAGFNVEFDPSTGVIMHISMICMLWTLPVTFAGNNPGGTFQEAIPIPSPFALIGNIPLTFLRLVFVYQMYKLYEGRTTRKRTILVGAASELQITAIGILSVIMPVFSLMSRFFIPVPLLFLAALIAIKIASPPEDTAYWKSSGDTENWWEKSSNK